MFTTTFDWWPAAPDRLKTIIAALGEGLNAPLAYPLDPSKRLYWLFALSSAGFAVLVLYLQNKKITWRRVRRTFFSSQYWLNTSTLTDLVYLFGNSVLKSALIVPLLGSHLIATLWVARGLQSQLGNGPAIEAPWLLIAATYTAVFFIAEDFSRFYLHRCMHKLPLLWRFHKTHHSAHILTPLTLHRIHPVEMVLFYSRGLLVFGTVSGTAVYLFGGRLSGLDILGVDLLGFFFNFFAANLRHSHIWFSFGPMERWLISPAQHQLHHSSAVEHRNKNFGASLALWDRWFGSWLPAGKPLKLRFGLAVYDEPKIKSGRLLPASDDSANSPMTHPTFRSHEPSTEKPA